MSFECRLQVSLVYRHFGTLVTYTSSRGYNELDIYSSILTECLNLQVVPQYDLNKPAGGHCWLYMSVELFTEMPDNAKETDIIFTQIEYEAQIERTLNERVFDIRKNKTLINTIKIQRSPLGEEFSLLYQMSSQKVYHKSSTDMRLCQDMPSSDQILEQQTAAVTYCTILDLHS